MSKKTFNLFGTIVNDDSDKWFTSDVTPKNFSDFLKGCEGDDEIEIAINSPGGFVTGGLAIANMVKSAKQKITAKVYGIAASMASVVACAADDVVMFKNSFMMVHNPWGFAWGDADDMKKEAAVLDSMKTAIIDFYRSKFPNVESDTLATMMDDETWMLGSEAETYGLITKIEDDPLQAAACITGPAVFGKIPEAAAKFYRSSKDRSLGVQESRSLETPQTPQTPKLLDSSNSQPSPCQHCAALQAEIQTIETQRRDHQSKADRLTQDMAKLTADHKAELDTLTARVNALTAEKTDLEKRIGSTALNALKTPDQACAQTWGEALAECGSYEAAKKKYPELATAYQLAHARK